MIYTHENFLDELEKLHPEVERESLEIITRKGLQGINKVMRSGQELIITGHDKGNKSKDWIKFFIYMTPETQQKHALRNYYRKQRKQERKNQEIDGQSTNDK